MSSLVKAFKIPELRKKLLFTFLMLTILYVLTLVPAPGMNVPAFSALVRGWGDVGVLMGIISGKAVYNASIVSLSVYPYLFGMIVVQIITAAVPSLRNLSFQNEAVQKRITKYTRLAAIAAGFIFSILLVTGSRSALITTINPWISGILAVIGFTIGSGVVSWMCELITSKGVGNGFSVILFAAVCRNIPSVFKMVFTKTNDKLGLVWAIVFTVLLAVIGAAALIFCAYVQTAERRIKLLFNKRSFGMKQYMGQNTQVPIKITQAGILPIIYTMLLITTPALIIAFYAPNSENAIVKSFVNFTTSPSYLILFAIGIVFFANVFALMQFNPTELSNELRNNNGYIPGVKPGKPTTEFLTKMFANMNMAGTVFLVLMCFLPMLIALIPALRSFWCAGMGVVILTSTITEMLTLLDNGIKEYEDKKKQAKPTKSSKAFR
ncbi:protein translocase subunit secY/sec61 alpha [Ruminococcaceae bacterium YRB3002]|nr:protein translocase subunit secY/sec61 alpha [Ruminococcaceae bacterium YRB3002]